MAFLLIVICLWNPADMKADAASAVSVGTIDYEAMTLQIYYNSNSLIYYSTDNSTWEEAEGFYDSTAKSISMDISWISEASDTALYLKGDVVKTVKTLTIPAYNNSFSVVYDKAEGDFTFDGYDNAETFEWRKASDYHWMSVSFNEASSSYQSFLSKMEYFRLKGANIIIRLPQVKGTSLSKTGSRPSAEVSITITARGAAPTVKVNSSKLTMNTTGSIEYYETSSGLWVECDGSMTVEDLAPKALYANGAKTVTLMLRKAATTSAPYSKTQYLTITAQDAAPTIGDNSKDVTYYYLNSKLVLQFNKATSNVKYEYTIVKSDDSLDLTTANWKSVTSNKIMTLSQSMVPDGCTVYLRKKGTDANAKVALVLSSDISSFTVNY